MISRPLREEGLGLGSGFPIHIVMIISRIQINGAAHIGGIDESSSAVVSGTVT